jgi:hypothetical protein
MLRVTAWLPDFGTRHNQQLSDTCEGAASEGEIATIEQRDGDP